MTDRPEDLPVATVVGYSTRDLVIQANTKLDLLSPQLAEVRAALTSLDSRVDLLEKAQDQAAAHRQATDLHEDKTFTRKQSWIASLYGAGLILATLFAASVHLHL